MSRTWSPKRAKEARVAAGYEPADAAEAVGVHLSSVYAWEAGRQPRAQLLGDIADAYGVTIDSLFVVHDGSNGSSPDGHGGITPEATRK